MLYEFDPTDGVGGAFIFNLQRPNYSATIPPTKSVVLSYTTYNGRTLDNNPTDEVGGVSYTTYNGRTFGNNPTDVVGGAFIHDLPR